jgi:hypothetical protein
MKPASQALLFKGLVSKGSFIILAPLAFKKSIIS